MEFRSPFAPFAVDLARAAGARLLAILPESASDKEIRLKGPTDVVTRADHEVEAIIASALEATFPDHGLLAEEGSRRQGAEYRWIVDPLDGTANFAHGLPWFAVSMALEEHGQITLGVVYHPPLDELFIAERSSGAWLVERGRLAMRLQVTPTADLISSIVATGVPAPQRAGRYFHVVPRFMPRTREVRIMGSAAIHLAYVAAGRLDAFWEPGLNPWDVAAGVLLVEEAGGRVTDLEGGAFRGSDTLASNGAVHEAMLAVIREGSEG